MEENVKYILKDDSDVELSLKKMASIIVSKWKKIALICVVFGALAFAYNVTRPPYYDAGSTLASTMFASDEIMPIIEPLQEHVARKNYSELSSELNLELEKVEHLRDIRVVRTGSGEGLFTCRISMQVTDTGIIRLVQDAIVETLNSNKYLKNRFDRKKEQLTAIHKACIDEIEEMNAIKDRINKMEETNKNGLMVYPLNTHSELVHLEEKAKNIEMQIELLSIAYYLRPATIPNIKSGPQTLKNTLGFVILAAFASMLFLLVAEVMKQ